MWSGKSVILGWSSRDRKIGDFEKKMRGIQQRLPSKQKSPAKVSPKPFLDIVLVGSKTRPCQNYLSHQKCSWFETFLGTKITIWDARNGYFSLWRSGSHRNQKWIPNQQPLWRRLTLPNPLLWCGWRIIDLWCSRRPSSSITKREISHGRRLFLITVAEVGHHTLINIHDSAMCDPFWIISNHAYFL